MNRDNALLERIEARHLWAYFHKDFLLQLRALIRPQVPKRYSIFVESESVVVAPVGSAPEDAVSAGAASGAILPDLSVARRDADASSGPDVAGASRATLEVEEACEIVSTYSLLIRRSPENRLVAAAEMLSPTNKGVHGELERERYLRKRAQYLEAGVGLLEIDALTEGRRLLPVQLAALAEYARNAWTVAHEGARRLWRGWGWNAADPLPQVEWKVEEDIRVRVDLAEALAGAIEFNPWEDLAK